ncbi:hypothetical protein FACHB389_28930 [Nostoc calcicola FACHB-389]|nr:hypothetical protein [Nostoc calcicola FACHB-3891]OKH27230.1 hypothetical protein FACHB389_28930 [Nostoc calcicola FACHB-389]
MPSRGKGANPNYMQISGYVPRELGLKFKISCTAKEITHSEALEQMINNWLEENEQPPTLAKKEKSPKPAQDKEEE